MSIQLNYKLEHKNTYHTGIFYTHTRQTMHIKISNPQGLFTKNFDATRMVITKTWKGMEGKALLCVSQFPSIKTFDLGLGIPKSRILRTRLDTVQL